MLGALAAEATARAIVNAIAAATGLTLPDGTRLPAAADLNPLSPLDTPERR
ncbi:MAG TPA: hypothetical protein PKE61_01075 [Burkholderiaceae bacterium]|nr:hypothetical protein [Burkholderiaceae bacterium]